MAFTITAGSSLSSSLPLLGNTIIGFQFIDGWTAASMTFAASPDDTNYGAAYDSGGSEITITVPTYAANMVVFLSTDMIATIGKVKYLKVRSGTSGSAVNQVGTVHIVPVYGAL